MTPDPLPQDRGLIGLVTRRPVAVLMMVLAVATFGLVSLSKLPVTLLPDISYPTLTVRTEYQGAAPSEVEKLVTRRIEENLSVISNLVSYRSISRAGVSDVILDFEWETPMVFATQDVREKVDQLRPFLPQEVGQPLILRYDPTLDPVMRIALYDNSRDRGVDLFDIRRLAEEDLKRTLEGLPGVAAVRVRGGFEEEWRVELSESRLKDRGVQASQVSERIGLENANVASGVLRDGSRESLVRTLGELATIDELRELVVAHRGENAVMLKDLGRVYRANKERDIITRVGKRESVELEIFKEAGANIVELAKAIKLRLFGENFQKVLEDGVYKDENRKAESAPKRGGSERGGRGGRRGRGGPSRLFEVDKRPIASILAQNGLGIQVLSDQSTFIEASINDVRNAALFGAVLAIIVLFAFLRRAAPTLIISVAIPVSIVATFAPMYLGGVSLNIMSLGGLALGVGMLVDSAIVVLESITRKREQGLNIRPAAIAGTREVGLAVMASTLTTVAVFLPMVFVEGIAGEFFRDQALTVVFSLLASLVAALFFIPMLASRSIVKPKEESDRFSWLFLPLEFLGVVLRLIAKGLGLILSPLLYLFDKAWQGVEFVFRWLLWGSLKVRLLVVLLAIGLGALTWLQVRTLGIELVPKVHQGEFTIESSLDVGTPVATTDHRTREIATAARAALDRAGVELAGLSTSAGVPRDVIAKAGEGRHSSKVYVRLKSTKDIRGTEETAIAAIRRELRNVPGLADPVITRPSLFTTRTSLEVEILGPNLEDLKAASVLVEDAMRGLPELTDIQSTRGVGYPELVVTPNREMLTFYGFDARRIANLIREKVQGSVSTRISQGDRKIDVLVRTPRSEVSSADDLMNLHVPSATGEPVPISTLATVEQRPGPAEIRRVSGERAIIVSADVEGLDLGSAATMVEDTVQKLRRDNPSAFEEVVVRMGGQQEESKKSVQSMLLAGLIAVFLVYIVMASQFESLLHPLIILFTIPLALIGVVWVLKLLTIKVSVVVLIGIILLAGIVVNNAIVLVDHVNQLRRSGMDRDPALKQASAVRLRPIFMTTLTTVLGLVPLALGFGEGAEIRKPMAITVIAGLATSTLLTLVVIPVVYSLVCRKGPMRSTDREPAEQMA